MRNYIFKVGLFSLALAAASSFAVAETTSGIHLNGGVSSLSYSGDTTPENTAISFFSANIPESIDKKISVRYSYAIGKSNSNSNTHGPQFVSCADGTGNNTGYTKSIPYTKGLDGGNSYSILLKDLVAGIDGKIKLGKSPDGKEMITLGYEVAAIENIVCMRILSGGLFSEPVLYSLKTTGVVLTSVQKKPGDYLDVSWPNNYLVPVKYPVNIGLQTVGDTTLADFQAAHPGEFVLTGTGSHATGVYLLEYGKNSVNTSGTETEQIRIPASAGTSGGIPPGKYKVFLEFKDANGAIQTLKNLQFTASSGDLRTLEIITKDQKYTINTVIPNQTTQAKNTLINAVPKKPVILKGVKAPVGATVGAKTVWTLSATASQDAVPVFSVADWGDGTTGGTAPFSTSGTFVSGLSAVFEHIFGKPGIYNVKFVGTDTKTNVTSTGVKKVVVKDVKAVKETKTKAGGTDTSGNTGTANSGTDTSSSSTDTNTSTISSSSAAITVTSQATDVTVKLGAPLSVTWNSSAEAKKEKIMIYLVPEADGGTSYILRNSVSNDGKTTGLVLPRTVKPGVYHVKVMIKGKEDSASTSTGKITIPEKTSFITSFTASIIDSLRGLFGGL